MSTERHADGAQWGEAESAVPPRRRPRWLRRGCGCGCILVLLTGLICTVLLYRMYKVGSDPEVQWPRLDQVLPFDRRPEDIGLELGLSLGADIFRLIERDTNTIATLTVFSPLQPDEVTRQLQPDAEYPMDVGKPLDPVPGTISVQGREVPCLRFSSIVFMPDGKGAGIRIDLGVIGDRPRLFELRHPGSASVEDSEVTRFLAPFDVWRER